MVVVTNSGLCLPRSSRSGNLFGGGEEGWLRDETQGPVGPTSEDSLPVQPTKQNSRVEAEGSLCPVRGRTKKTMQSYSFSLLFILEPWSFDEEMTSGDA